MSAPRIAHWGRRYRRFGIALLVAEASCRPASEKRAVEERAAAEEAKALSEQQARADEFKRRDEEAAALHARQYPAATPAVENPLFAGRRDLLAKLAANPRAIGPKAVTPASADEPFTTYEYAIEGLGEVIQWRTNASDWSMNVPAASPEMFAPAGGIRPVVTIGPVSWWRVTSGPFDQAFLLKSSSSVVLHSMKSVCSGKVALPALADECNRY